MMSNSSLVTYRHIVTNKTLGRGGNKITKIFVHHMAGNLTVKQCGSVFDNRQASAHYGVNGFAIGQYVDEKDTAWHCGNFYWNQRSIGIELANDGGAGSNWHVSDKTINTAIKLIADICKRNGIKKLNYTGDMSGNLCMHRWVASTTCPAAYLASQFKRIAKEVNKKLTAKAYVPKTAYKGKLPTKTLKHGDRGEQVKRLKEFLKWRFNFSYSNDVYGSGTEKAVKDFQRKYAKQYGLKVDGVFGKASRQVAQKIVDKYEKKYGPDPLQKWYDAMTTQFNWSKNQVYDFNTYPTVENSEREGTCITFPNVALQRLGLMPVGGYVYLYPSTMRINGNSIGKNWVANHPEIFEVSYPNKTIAQLGSNIKKGDIIGFGGSDYHTMVYMGKNSSGQPIFNTMGHYKGLGVTYPNYQNRPVGMIIRLKKVK